jgi:DNA polymerase (family 10)
LADLLELDQANPYRVRSYRRAAGIIRTYRRSLAEMVLRGEDLTQIRNIGPDSAAKIREIVLTGSSHFLDKIQQQVPSGLQHLSGVPGLGPQRIRSLYEKLGIRNLTQLRQAAKSHKIQSVPGFGELIEKRILQQA